jgi:hypothetical protein
VVVHACNPIYEGDRDQEEGSAGKKLVRSHLNEQARHACDLLQLREAEIGGSWSEACQGENGETLSKK